MLFLQLKQAEVAMADGRLDEAYHLVAGSKSLQSHRRGQTLITRLTDHLVARATAHFEAGRATESLADCEKARNLAGNLEEVVALRARIEDEMVAADRTKRSAARQGMLHAATGLVDSAIGREDLDRAVAEIVRARGQGVDNTHMRDADSQVRKELTERIEQALSDGRLDQIGALLERLERLDPAGLTTLQFVRAYEQARIAWSCIRRRDMLEAQEALCRLSAQAPGLKWVAAALEQLAAAEQAMRSVRTGPLGLLAMGDTTLPPTNTNDLPQPSGAPDDSGTPGVPQRFILQVDGAGSYLVMRGSSITLGPISSSRRPDVGLIAEATAAVVTIERIEDDYFLKMPGQPGKLLSDGDRIALSPRCRLQFNLPNPASTSATLEVVGGRFPRADIKRVILLDRDLIVGPGNGAHIRADHAASQAVLHVRDARLWHRSQLIDLARPANVAGAGIVMTRA
jgi:hypothetical protein